MGNLESYAKEELERAGLFGPESDYGGMIGESVMKMIKEFADEGHSGNSAMQTLAIFQRLAQYKPLTPLTYGPEEWNEVGTNVWQNRRDSEVFSIDGGKTHYSLTDKEK